MAGKALLADGATATATLLLLAPEIYDGAIERGREGGINSRGGHDGGAERERERERETQTDIAVVA